MPSSVFLKEPMLHVRWDFFLRERVSRGERGQSERISSRLHAGQGARCGTQSHDPEIVTWAKIKSQRLNQLSHPGTPSWDL